MIGTNDIVRYLRERGKKKKKRGKKECYKFALSPITIVCRLGKLNSAPRIVFY